VKSFSTHSDVVCEPSGFVDITDDIRKAVAAAGISSGRATVISRKAGCTIFLNENESGLKQDLVQAFERFNPSNGSHAGVGSPSVVLPVDKGDLWMGDWQRVLAHLDTPSDVVIHVWGI
jgi:thiamine phosphate synthase YjbQ (UPF0047 family)